MFVELITMPCEEISPNQHLTLNDSPYNGIALVLVIGMFVIGIFVTVISTVCPLLLLPLDEPYFGDILINSGDIKLLAEVVRDLFRSDSQPEQSYSERQLYEASRERLAREVAVIEKTDEQKAIEKMETILNNSNGRNDDLESEEID